MPETEVMKAGTFCWTELHTRDVDNARKFYSLLIGWEITPVEIGGNPYNMVATRAGEQVGGMFSIASDEHKGVTPHWMPYIFVDDIHATCDKCRKLGGAVLVEPSVIPDIGFWAHIEDPTGAQVGLFQGKVD